MMLCSLIIYLVGIIFLVGIELYCYMRSAAEDSLGLGVLGIVVGILSIYFTLSGFPISCWKEVAQEQIKEEEYREIVSSKDTTRTKGEYFLFVGFSSEEGTYSYYYMTDNWGYKRENLESDYITIFEKDNCTPRVTKVKIRITFELWGLKDYRTVEGYNIYVPKGSVSTDFKFDAE